MTEVEGGESLGHGTTESTTTPSVTDAHTIAHITSRVELPEMSLKKFVVLTGGEQQAVRVST